MASNKPKNPQVGVIECRYHLTPVQAKVMRSLAKNKFYISCPECGLIMPTLAAFQEYIKSHARFNQDINSGVNGKPLSPTADVDAGKTKQQQTKPQEQKQKAETPAAEEQPQAKPKPVKSNYDQEMGF